jgi:large subunit ribosomal protein L23
MALLDFLKKKEEAEKAKKPEKVLSVKKSEKKSEEIKKDTAIKPKTGKVKEFSYEAVKQPHISEKGSYLAEKDQYIFKVSPGYNKKEVQNAVEGIYGVDVLSVNIVKIPAKKRRLGRTEGFRKAYKKAIVKIKNGQKIEIL